MKKVSSTISITGLARSETGLSLRNESARTRPERRLNPPRVGDAWSILVIHAASPAQNPFTRPWKYSRIGPNTKKGKKVSTTRMIMLPTRMIEKARLSVFNPTSGLLFLLIQEPASMSRRAMGTYRPRNMTIPVDTLKNGVFPVAPRKSEPLFAADVVNSYKTEVNPLEFPETPIA